MPVERCGLCGRATLTTASAPDSFLIYFIHLALLWPCKKLHCTMYCLLLLLLKNKTEDVADSRASRRSRACLGIVTWGQVNFINLIYTLRIHRNSYFQACFFVRLFFVFVAHFSFVFAAAPPTPALAWRHLPPFPPSIPWAQLTFCIWPAESFVRAVSCCSS